MLGCLDIQLATCQPFRSYPRPSARSSLLIYTVSTCVGPTETEKEDARSVRGVFHSTKLWVSSFFPYLLLQMENRKLYRFPFTVDNNAVIKRTRLFVTTFRPVETKMKIGCYVTVYSFFRWKNVGTNDRNYRM